MSVAAFLAERIAHRLGRDPADIGHDVAFEALGLESAATVELSGELERHLGRTLPATLLYEHPTIAALAQALERPEPDRAARRRAAPRAGEPVAIVGIGCRLPGGAGDPAALWQLVTDRVDAIGAVPEGRWPTDGLDASVPLAGGFLDDVEGFEPEAFGISPREAAVMDPHQRLLLEVVWESLEDAMIAPTALDGSDTAVFVGISAMDWSQMVLGDGGEIDRYATTGGALSIAANRISYALNLTGPSVSLDTACSSSLVALDLARRALQSGECELALAAGVNLLLRPHVSLALARARMLSADGRCRSFAEGADGFGRGEGACVLALKPLAAAREDGDRVYAVLRGSAVGSDGRTNGLTAPSGAGQRAVLRAALHNAGVAPADIGYVEAQGTGTTIGDAIEAEALGAVMGEGRGLDSPCAVGALKSNIGHLEAAAGVAAVAKTALALHHRVLPPSLYADQPRPDIPFDLLGLRLQSDAEPWPSDAPPVAGVSAFGFGGTNAHAVLSAP